MDLFVCDGSLKGHSWKRGHNSFHCCSHVLGAIASFSGAEEVGRWPFSYSLRCHVRDVFQILHTVLIGCIRNILEPNNAAGTILLALLHFPYSLWLLFKLPTGTGSTRLLTTHNFVLATSLIANSWCILLLSRDRMVCKQDLRTFPPRQTTGDKLQQHREESDFVLL